MSFIAYKAIFYNQSHLTFTVNVVVLLPVYRSEKRGEAALLPNQSTPWWQFCLYSQSAHVIPTAERLRWDFNDCKKMPCPLLQQTSTETNIVNYLIKLRDRADKRAALGIGQISALPWNPNLPSCSACGSLAPGRSRQSPDPPPSIGSNPGSHHYIRPVL